MAEITYREAVIQAMAEEMRRDDTVFLIGEDVGPSGGIFKCSEGLFDEFDPVALRVLGEAYPNPAAIRVGPENRRRDELDALAAEPLV